ncbi:MAG: M3 family peptidase, partial [Verrucomicrobiota bacterium]
MSQFPHPFLQDDFHIRWSTLIPEAIEADIQLALAEAQKRIDALCGEFDPSELTFDNTLLALEKSTEGLSQAWGLVGHLDSVRNSDELREAQNEMLPKVTQFYSRIPLNDDLWKRIKAYSESEEASSLSGVRARFLEETVNDFVRSGADLPEEKKARLEEVQSELARVTQKFSENVLDSTNAWELVLEDDSRLEGLPETAKAVLQAEAQAKELGTEEKPVYRITLKAPVYF